MERTILFVDDEEFILNSLKRLFRGKGFKVLTALSGEEGLKIVEDEDVGVVVSDQLMSGIKGVDFLVKVREMSPDTVRVLLTGHADMEVTVAAINEGGVYRYVCKPWHDEDLVICIEQCLEYGALRAENRSMTNTIKKHLYVLTGLEKKNPGITEVVKDSRGCVVMGGEALKGLALYDWSTD